MSASATNTAFPWTGLITLGAAIFIAITSEFLPTGLLPEMAEGLDVSRSSVGLLVTVFAGTVVVTAAALASLTRKLPRKPLLLVVLVVFAVSNFIAALAPSYEVLLASRVLGALAHGLFWAVAGAYPSHLVQTHHLARAIAITASGGAIAFVLGVPAGTAIGHLLGWRPAFTLVGIVILLLAVLVWKFLPTVNHIEPLKTGEIPLPLRKDPSLFGVLLICGITTLLMMGQNVFYTYIVPYLTDVNLFPSESVSVLLLVYGLAGALGLVLVGIFGGRYPRAGLIGGFVLVLIAVLLIGLIPTVPVVVIAAIVVWGMTLGGAPAMLQTRLLHTASRRMRDVAVAYLTTSFNVGIGIGALIGSLVLDSAGLEA
ncbi:MAG: MFS transporter, partial [Terrimesophilobacter sp.]